MKCADCDTILGALYRAVGKKQKRRIVCNKCADIEMGVRKPNGQLIRQE